MLTYLLVALGGAIGSVLRAWLNTAVVSVTGPAFPWGTILINVVGSAVIGFFATLTATDGRFGVATEWRTFVMVGLCGGFTTFSSFSLQTLELARDGRAGQALGNVALSVVLCLASVSAGYALAMAIRTEAPARIGAGAGGVVVALQNPVAAAGLWSVVRQLTAENAETVTILALGGPGLAAFQPTEEVMTRDRAARRARWIDSMGRALDGPVSDRRDEGGAARWIAVRGHGAGAVAEHMRDAGLLVMEWQPEDRSVRLRLQAALVRSRRPVLLVPSGMSAPIGRVAVVWIADGRASMAVRASLPLLRRAEGVVVVRIGDGDELTPALRDVAVSTERISPGGHVGQTVLAIVTRENADLLVMGVYGHAGGRDARFDDVTEHLLHHATLPILLEHATV